MLWHLVKLLWSFVCCYWRRNLHLNEICCCIFLFYGTNTRIFSCFSPFWDFTPTFTEQDVNILPFVLKTHRPVFVLSVFCFTKFYDFFVSVSGVDVCRSGAWLNVCQMGYATAFWRVWHHKVIADRIAICSFPFEVFALFFVSKKHSEKWRKSLIVVVCAAIKQNVRFSQMSFSLEFILWSCLHWG